MEQKLKKMFNHKEKEFIQNMQRESIKNLIVVDNTGSLRVCDTKSQKRDKRKLLSGFEFHMLEIPIPHSLSKFYMSSPMFTGRKKHVISKWSWLSQTHFHLKMSYKELDMFSGKKKKKSGDKTLTCETLLGNF